MQTVKRWSFLFSLRYALAALECTTGTPRKASLQTRGSLTQSEHTVVVITNFSFEIVNFFLDLLSH